MLIMFIDKTKVKRIGIKKLSNLISVAVKQVNVRDFLITG